MIACARKVKELKWISHDKVEQVIGARPTAKDFKAQASKQLSNKPPPRWAERAPAFAAALVAMKGSG